jgi:hypothetical protein
MTIRVLLVIYCAFISVSVAPDYDPASSIQPDPVRFAVIGDYGSGSRNAAAVAEMVIGWNPDFIITTGDNNYPAGAAETIDRSIGQFYHDFIYPYTGDYGEGADRNRFFPVLGNHDVDTALGQPYLEYFVLPGNERYYDFVAGPVHLFALNSDWREPDGINSSSIQAEWLQNGLSASTSPWKLVYLHVPPYSSGPHGSGVALRWPYQEWGAAAVLSGHNHHYERVMIDGFPYFVNGAGGGGLYRFTAIVEGSVVRYNANYGAMLVTASADAVTFEFYSIADGGTLVDTYAIT